MLSTIPLIVRAICVSPSFLCRIENGSSTPNIDFICSVASALQCTPQDILCDIFVYSENNTTSEKIKLIIEKFPPQTQELLLETLQFFVSRLNEL